MFKQIKTTGSAGGFRLKTNSHTAKMRKVLYLSCEYIKTLIQKFREAENGFPKAFLLTSSSAPQRTICTPVGAVSSSVRVFHRLTACSQDFVYTLQNHQFNWWF